METQLDFGKVIKIIRETPETKPFLDDKTDGFKHLYETVYLPLSKYDADSYEAIQLNVDLSKFDSDELLKFYDFISSKYDSHNNSPLSTLDSIISKLPPLNKKQIFI